MQHLRYFAALSALLAVVSCGGITPVVPAGAVSFKTDVAPLLAQTCGGCHTPSGPGGFQQEIFDASGNVDYTHVSKGISQIVAATQRGRMPQGGSQLTAAQVGILQAWSTAGAPNN